MTVGKQMNVGEEKLVYAPFMENDGIQVSRSPWGPEDEIGRLNWITPESRRAITEQLDGRRMVDLSVDHFVGMPSWASSGDPQYQVWMTCTPMGMGNGVRGSDFAPVAEKHSLSVDSVSMNTHCGTHIDALNHVGYYGRIWNGWSASEHIDSRGWMKAGVDNYPPIVARGVLLDVAALHGVDCLPDSHPIGPDEIQAAARRHKVELRRGDVVVIRTGRMTIWPDFHGYLDNPPGITLAGARYLCEEAGAMCVGADSIALEVLPAQQPDAILPVHSYMFATAGTPIIEMLDLEALARAKLHEFAFLGFPIRLRGATGAPMRSAAMALRD